MTLRRTVSSACLAMLVISVGCAKGDLAADDTDAGGGDLPDAQAAADTSPPPGAGKDAGAVDSGPTCTNTSTDPRNCGACGHACGAKESCVAGACVVPCDAGTTACGASCVDTTGDLGNCGKCANACAGGAAAKCASGACSVTLHVRAFVDGRSDLLLQGPSAHWHHYAAAAPGLWGGSTEATTLGDVQWTPSWPGAGENRDCDCDSQASPAIPPMPAHVQTATLQVVQARGSLAIVQQPSAANGYALGVEIDDNPSGADWYDFTLSYATQ